MTHGSLVALANSTDTKNISKPNNTLLLTLIILAIGLMNISHAFAEKVISYVDPACVNHVEDETIDSIIFAGQFTGFVWGDFMHGEFVDNKGEQLSLFIETRDISCFLALHKGERITVTYDNVCRYIENGAGIYPAEEIVQIKAENDDLKTWRKKFDLSENDDFCEKLERKYTREP